MKKALAGLLAILIVVFCAAAFAKGDSAFTINMTSLGQFQYSAEEWFSTDVSCAYIAAAIYGEAPQGFRDAVGIPQAVYAARETAAVRTVPIYYIDFLDAAGTNYYQFTFYPEGTEWQPSMLAVSGGAASTAVSFSKKPYKTITQNTFALVYNNWQAGNMPVPAGEEKTEPEKKAAENPEPGTELFSLIGDHSENIIPFSMPSRGYIELTLNKSTSRSSSAHYGYYDIKIYKNTMQCIAINSYRFREKAQERYIIGLDQGDYLVSFVPKGYYLEDFVSTDIRCAYADDAYYEIESNNSIGKATVLELNKIYTGYLGDEDDTGGDVYAFRATAGKKVQIRFSEYEALGKTTAIARLIDSAGAETAMRLSQAANYRYYDFTPEQTGTCYVKLGNYSGIQYGAVRYQFGVFEEIDLESMNTLVLPPNLRSVKAEAFRGREYEAVVIPDGCVSIGSKAFADCPNLRYVQLPAGYIDIAEDAFDMQNGIQIERR